jgi:hypothetical protein
MIFEVLALRSPIGTEIMSVQVWDAFEDTAYKPVFGIVKF